MYPPSPRRDYLLSQLLPYNSFEEWNPPSDWPSSVGAYALQFPAAPGLDEYRSLLSVNLPIPVTLAEPEAEPPKSAYYSFPVLFANRLHSLPQRSSPSLHPDFHVL